MIDPAANLEAIDRIRDLARQGASPAAMYQELRRRLGPTVHVADLIDHFRMAFCLGLAEAKPLAALTRNESRDIADEAAFDDLLQPAIARHRMEWESLGLKAAA